MGIYITNPSTDEEDIAFIQELITNGKAYLDAEQGRICCQSDTESGTKKVLWERCDLNEKKGFLGDSDPISTPWGIGRITQEGYSYVFAQLVRQGRTISTLEPLTSE